MCIPGDLLFSLHTPSEFRIESGGSTFAFVKLVASLCLSASWEEVLLPPWCPLQGCRERWFPDSLFSIEEYSLYPFFLEFGPGSWEDIFFKDILWPLYSFMVI